MNRVFARLATLAVALPFAVGMVAGSAYAQSVTVPGCFGGGTDETIVCDLTITAETPSVSIGVVYVKVCAGACNNVPVQWVTPTAAAALCYDYKDGAGRPVHGCASDWYTVNMPSLSQLALDLVRCGPSSTLLCAYEA